jgi:hypothetical protein
LLKILLHFPLGTGSAIDCLSLAGSGNWHTTTIV